MLINTLGGIANLMNQLDDLLFGPAGLQSAFSRRHLPAQLPEHGSLIVTDPALLQAIAAAGGPAIAGAGLRVGVRADGTVSYMNPEYWYRAYLRKESSGSSGVMENKSNVKGLMIIASVVAVIIAILMLLSWMNSVARRDAAERESRQRASEIEEHVRRHSVELGTDAEEH